MINKKRLKYFFISIAVLTLVFVILIGIPPKPNKFIFTQPCEKIKSVSSETSYFFSLLFLKKHCWVSFVGMDGEKKFLRDKLLNQCLNSEKEKLAFIKRSNDDTWNIELLNDTRCGIARFFNTDPISFGYAPKVSAELVFKNLMPNTHMSFLKDMGFKILSKNKNIWTLHVYPASTVDIEVNNSVCGNKAECEDSVVIEKLMGTREEYVIENDSGEVESIQQRL